MTYIEDSDKRPSRFCHGLVVLFVVVNPFVIVVNSVFGIPSFILGDFSNISYFEEHRLTSGDDILTLLMFASMISLLSHTFSSEIKSAMASHRLLEEKHT